VVERGSPLTHVAVVARELGIPTVVQVKGATREIRTGMRVRVDGGAGLVTILENAPGPHAPGSALAGNAPELLVDNAEATA
jgi:pyruvate,water dikinase